MTIEETIDAFIDGETVDATALDAALAEAEGRRYLYDVLLLRGLVNRTVARVAAASSHTLTSGRAQYARVAVIALSLVGAGYVAGLLATRDEGRVIESTQQIRAPEPTRVIELTDLQTLKGGD